MRCSSVLCRCSAVLEVRTAVLPGCTLRAHACAPRRLPMTTHDVHRSADRRGCNNRLDCELCLLLPHTKAEGCCPSEGVERIPHYRTWDAAALPSVMHVHLQVRWHSNLEWSSWLAEDPTAERYRGLFNNRPSLMWQEVLGSVLAGTPSGVPSSRHRYLLARSE